MMPCNVISQRYGLQNVRNALNVLYKVRRKMISELGAAGLTPEAMLRNVGLGSINDTIKRVDALGNELKSMLGIKKPTKTLLLKLLVGLSPGSVKLFLDSDSGWFTEARVREGAPPVYHHVDDDMAMALLKGELSHALEAELMEPDEYIGE